jgi:hypothetical protein
MDLKKLAKIAEEFFNSEEGKRSMGQLPIHSEADGWACNTLKPVMD